ncbi:HSF-type DNA-binding protein [Nitzschia inconspicua]|uniref:HSF-type DNA-binding protein n=1 Tax=Nitzschia inconspicua TaxID=303405 RepID=A0A9K3LK10_9STRA|nr:HSF-type DNA-binding protein [Nitzschia inconspicua]
MAMTNEVSDEPVEKDSKMKASFAQTTVPFPWKLHEMLDRSDKDSFDHIVSWLPSGNGFKVYDSKAFVDTVLPRFFRQTKYKSFQRQCNIWGFERLLQGPHKGGYTHVDFIRGQTSLCSRMKRQKIKGSGSSWNISPFCGIGETQGSLNAVNKNLTTSTFTANCDSGEDSFTDATRAISPSFSMPLVEGRNYNFLESTCTIKVISTESLSELKDNLCAPERVHAVPVSPLPHSILMTEKYDPTPQTGDSVNFEGQKFFFIHDTEFATTANHGDQASSFRHQTHQRRLSLDLFAASRLDNDEGLVETLMAADAIPMADLSSISSSYFY